MALKLLCDYVIPCVLCEEPLEHVMIHRDESTGSESSQRVRLPHACLQMKELLSERNR